MDVEEHVIVHGDPGGGSSAQELTGRGVVGTDPILGVQHQDGLGKRLDDGAELGALPLDVLVELPHLVGADLQGALEGVPVLVDGMVVGVDPLQQLAPGGGLGGGTRVETTATQLPREQSVECGGWRVRAQGLSWRSVTVIVWLWSSQLRPPSRGASSP